MVWYRHFLEDSEQKDQSISESVNYEGAYRTAPATPDLFNMVLTSACLSIG